MVVTQGLLLAANEPDRPRWHVVLADAGIHLLGDTDHDGAVAAYEALRPQVVLPAADPEAPWRPLLAGARDYLTTPFGVAARLEQVFQRVRRDDGTPQTFMEELVGHHELGAALVRKDLVDPDVVEAARAAVREGRYANIFEALVADDAVPEQVLKETLVEGHKLVSGAFLVMKTKRVSMQQLRTAFLVSRHRGWSLRDALLDRGWCLPQDFDKGPWDDPPPPGAPAARRPRPGGPGGEAAAG